jgi:aspartyl-tRNA(Asn)/glutamyl-tRNA(Gln) amidotransferase subunit A
MNGITVGIPIEYHVDGVSDDVLDTWSKAIDYFESLGARIEQVSLPNTANALSSYYIIAPAEAYSNLACYDGIRYGFRAEATQGDSSFCKDTRTIGFGNEVKRRLMVGAHVLKSSYRLLTRSSNRYFMKAQQIRALVQQDFDRIFKPNLGSSHNSIGFSNRVDVLLTPASMTTAPTLDQVIKKEINPYVNDVFTIPTSLAGLPAIVVPCKHQPLPIGLQLIGDYGNDELVLWIASQLEQMSK